MSLRFYLVLRLPPSTTRTGTLFPYTTLCRSDGVTVIALARDDQIALAAAEIVQRNALEIVRERVITLDRIDQTRRCRTAGLGIETPQCDILFGDIDRA